jgi:hypothetical protein
MDVAPTNGNRPWEPDLCPLCPSCGQVWETCKNILLCNHSDRIETWTHLIDLLQQWLVEVDTDPDLWEGLVEYARGQGGRTMTEICRGMDNRYRRVAEEQDLKHAAANDNQQCQFILFKLSCHPAATAPPHPLPLCSSPRRRRHCAAALTPPPLR